MSGESSISIIRRFVESCNDGISPRVAEAILELDFVPSDHARMDELGAKSNRGELTAEEAKDYDAYIEAADLLAFWQSKARLCLRRQPAQV
jgi:hypothetical protein